MRQDNFLENSTCKKYGKLTQPHTPSILKIKRYSINHVTITQSSDEQTKNQILTCKEPNVLQE